MRDDMQTFSNKQSLTVPSAGDLAPTNSTNTIAPQAYGPYSIFLRVKNTGANAMVNGTFMAVLQFSTDGGTTWNTNDELEISIPASALVAGASVLRRVVVDRDEKNDLGVASPSNLRLRLVYSSTGHTNAAAVSLQVTAYIHPAGVGAIN